MFCEALPRELWVSGRAYPIDTDFRAWIRLTETLLDPRLEDLKKAAACLALYQKAPADLPEALTALLEFYRAGALPAKKGGKGPGGRPVFSYTYDGGYLLAAFRQAYRMDLLTLPYLHWWEFRWLFDGLPEDCELKRRMAYRSIRLSDIKDKKQRQRMRRIQQAIALPAQTVDDESIGEALWMGGGGNG